MAKCDVYVVGMRVEQFVDYGPGDSAYDEEPMSNKRYILFCTSPDRFTTYRFTISLETKYGWCGSGWTTATWGRMDIEQVSSFGPATHLPKDRKIKLENVEYDTLKRLPKGLCFYEYESDDEYMDHEILTNVFGYSGDGDDSYYPRGGTFVNMDLFNELPRAIKGRPVWIFNGSSGSGKTTIGHELSADKIIYETDYANNGNLPKEIWADIIVVGNKWKDVTVDVVKEHLPDDCVAIDVRFDM